jgi:hypothetical protein
LRAPAKHPRRGIGGDVLFPVTLDVLRLVAFRQRPLTPARRKPVLEEEILSSKRHGGAGRKTDARPIGDTGPDGARRRRDYCAYCTDGGRGVARPVEGRGPRRGLLVRLHGRIRMSWCHHGCHGPRSGDSSGDGADRHAGDRHGRRLGVARRAGAGVAPSSPERGTGAISAAGAP